MYLGCEACAILGLQLEKLCEMGEIVRIFGWRYVLKVEDEVKEQCEDIENGKRGKRKSNKRARQKVLKKNVKRDRF